MYTLRYTVPPEQDGRLIKRVIRGSMGLSYHQFSLIKAAGGMLLDGRSVHANERVRAGQAIELTLVEPEGRVPPQDAPVAIVYEDEHLLVIDKSAPLACQSSPRQSADTLENRLAHRFAADPSFTFRPVNRLDKGTSGLMVAARHAHAQMLLSRQLHTDELTREYVAVVVGAPPTRVGTIDQPIRKVEGATIKREVHPDGRAARTDYETIRSVNGVSLVKLKLHTGRTHQIRVHMRSLGCPIVGDFLYGEEDARLPGRFALHSSYLTLTHPMTGERLSFESPPPDEIKRLIEQ